MRRKPPLPVELEKQLQQVKDVRRRASFRKQLKNDIAVIKECEKWIKKSEEPYVPSEDPFPSEEEQTYFEELKQRRLERVPEHRQLIEKMKERITRTKKEVKEAISNA